MTCSYSKEFSALGYTDVENVFIYEYMPNASGNAVKVYLYGLFLCQHQEFDQTLDVIAKNLSMSEEEVKDAFMFWEELGLVSVVSYDPYTVLYQPVRATEHTRNRKYKPEKYADFTKGLQELLPQRMISTSEYTEYFSIMETYGIKPEAMLMIVKYCVDKKSDDVSYRYISKVAKDFGKRGLVTYERVENELSSYVLRTGNIAKILQALSIKRQPDYDDALLYKKWTEELGFDAENIIFASKKFKRGSIEKFDSFIMQLYSAKCFSKEEIENYLDGKKKVFDIAVNVNKALSIYVEVMDTVIDTYTTKWLSFGYDEETLILIAHKLFVKGQNTLQNMDSQIEYLRQHGFVDLSSVGDYYESLKRTDDFIAELLMNAGLTRRPTDWDREMLATWKSWNFTDEMILKAASLSAGKSSPIAYMTKILSNWKNNGIYSADTIIQDDGVSVADYNKEYEKRRKHALSVAEKNLDKALKIEGFAEIYARLNSIEKDLAFAEINNETDLLKEYENEKERIYKKGEELLSHANLTYADLEPKYFCSKCNDTGYVGNGRCDCFDKKPK